MEEQEITKQVRVQNVSNEGIRFIVQLEDQSSIETDLHHEEMRALIRFYLGYVPAWEVMEVGREVLDLLKQLGVLVWQSTGKDE